MTFRSVSNDLGFTDNQPCMNCFYIYFEDIHGSYCIK